MQLRGFHHLTAITGDIAGNRKFFTDTLGMRLVKKTVNQDNPTVYHLFFADEAGDAGSDLTFFEYPGAPRGRAGGGMVHRIASRVASAEALDFWEERLGRHRVATERDGDLPSALELARRASSFRFGPPSHAVVALDLPSVYFTPDYEEHYYRALATMGEAAKANTTAERRLALQTASLLWSLYFDRAQRDAEPWAPNARAHRDACRRQLAQLDAERREAASEPGRDED